MAKTTKKMVEIVKLGDFGGYFMVEGHGEKDGNPLFDGRECRPMREMVTNAKGRRIPATVWLVFGEKTWRYAAEANGNKPTATKSYTRIISNH